MPKQLTKVREFSFDNKLSWVVDILGNQHALDGYVMPDGTTGNVSKGSGGFYDRKIDAEAAEALYLAKNAGSHNGIETSAGKPTCNDCLYFDKTIKPYPCKKLQMSGGQNDLVNLCTEFRRKISTGRKETNPKDVIGMKKAPISTLSCAVLFEMGLGLLEGARKYGRHNYRAMGVSATIYYDASVGHLMDWFEGEDIDEDSGLCHVTKALTALLVLRDSMLCGNWVDDRPLRNPNKLYKKHFNPKAEAIIEKYPDAKEPYLEARKDTPRGG